MSDDRTIRSLRRLIRSSPALDPAARRQWLAVLPHLSSEDRQRLRTILAGADRSDGMAGPDGSDVHLAEHTPSATALRQGGAGGEASDLGEPPGRG